MKLKKNHKIFNPNNSYYIHLFISPSPHLINWNSPKKLLISMFFNAISGLIGRRNITLGHTNMELVMDSIKIPLGMHYRYKKEGFNLLKNNSGLGILFHNMCGRFNTLEDIDFAKNDFQHGKTSIITFILNKEQYNSIKKFRELFLKNGEQYNYGLNNNPLYGPSFLGEKYKPINNDMINFGSGCSAFIIAVLKYAGINDQKVFDHWSSEIKIGESLIGPYSDKLYKTKSKKRLKLNKKIDNPVSLISIFNSKLWFLEKELTKSINYYSPNLMNKWIIDFIKTPRKNIFGKKVKNIFINKYKKNTSYQIILE